MAEITKRKTVEGSLFPKEIGLKHLDHEGGTTGDCSITAESINVFWCTERFKQSIANILWFSTDAFLHE